MFIVMPFKVKNPPKAFPYATVSLMALNVLVFAATSQYFLAIRRPMVEAYALRWGVSSPINILTAMFLHADILHLAGNMLFLWIFGPAVEDRLKIPGYLGLYFLAGFAADVAQATLGAASGVSAPGLGASGAIMGVLGAYWYLFSWSTVCVFYFIWMLIRPYFGVFEVAAAWVIGAYFVMDLANGIISKATDVGGGVANFAHVGGAVCGFVLVWALRLKRDTGEVSKARAAQAVVGDVNVLHSDHIRNLAAHCPEDDDLIVALAERAAQDGSAEDMKRALDMNQRTVVNRCPGSVVHYITALQGSDDIFSAADLVYLGKWCESVGKPDLAIRMYEIVETDRPTGPELEIALFRTAVICWRTRRESVKAVDKLDKLLTLFPAGVTMFDAEDLRAEILQETSQAA